MCQPPEVGDRVVKRPCTGHECDWHFADRGVVVEAVHVPGFKAWYMVRWDGHRYPSMAEASAVVRATDLGERYSKPHEV